MNENKGLALIGPTQLALLKEQAQIVVQSGMLPADVTKWQDVVVLFMQGAELGIGPMASLSGINVIHGRPTVSPQLMLGLINRSGEAEDLVIESDAKTCKVTMKRKGRAAFTTTFSMQDAAKIQTKEKGQYISLSEKYNWRQMPAVMLRWRAVAACARIVYPDIIGGLYTADEMGAEVAYDDAGGALVLDQQRDPPPTNITPPSTPAPSPAPPTTQDPPSSDEDSWQDHIARTPGWNKALWITIKEQLDLTADEAHWAAGVASFSDFKGTKLQLKRHLSRASKEKGDDEPITNPDDEALLPDLEPRATPRGTASAAPPATDAPADAPPIDEANAAQQPPHFDDAGSEVSEGTFVAQKIIATRIVGGQPKLEVWAAEGEGFGFLPIVQHVSMRVLMRDTMLGGFGVDKAEIAPVGTMIYNAEDDDALLVVAHWEDQEGAEVVTHFEIVEPAG